MAPFELFGRNFCLATLQHWLCVVVLLRTENTCRPGRYGKVNRAGQYRSIHCMHCPSGSPCRTGPAGIEQIRSLVSVSRLLLVAFPSPSPIGGERSDVSTLYNYVV